MVKEKVPKKLKSSRQIQILFTTLLRENGGTRGYTGTSASLRRRKHWGDVELVTLPSLDGIEDKTGLIDFLRVG